MTVNGGFQTWANHTHYLGVGFRLIRVGIVYCTAYSLCWLRGLVHKGKLIMTSRFGRSGTWLKGASNVSHKCSILQVEFVAASKFKKKQPASKNELLPRRMTQSGSNYMQLSSFAMRPSSTWASRPGWQNFSHGDAPRSSGRVIWICHTGASSRSCRDQMTGWLKTGRWFGTWLLWLSIILGISSSQLTNSIIFQRGRAKKHQPAICSYMFPWFMGKMSHISICFPIPPWFSTRKLWCDWFFSVPISSWVISSYVSLALAAWNPSLYWLLMVIPRDSYDIYIVY